MAINPSSILTKEDMEKERTPDELFLWWEKKSQDFASSQEGHHYALLKKGLTGKFCDEIYPLNLLANILYKGRSDIGCFPNLSNDNFDAVIKDYSKSPPSEQKIEVTLAIDGYDDILRREHLVKHGHVPLTGPYSHSGTKRTGHNIVVESEAVSHYELLNDNFALIKCAAGKKVKTKKTYGKDHVLLIVIEDYLAPRYDKPEDINALNQFIESNVINLPLDFNELYILGYSGNTLLRFQLDI
jgi:hypothetical protein